MRGAENPFWRPFMAPRAPVCPLRLHLVTNVQYWKKKFMTASGMAKKVGFDSATLDAELIRNMDFALFQVALA